MSKNARFAIREALAMSDEIARKLAEVERLISMRNELDSDVIVLTIKIRLLPEEVSTIRKIMDMLEQPT